MELGSTREVPGVTRPLVSREVRSDGADVCGKGFDASDIEFLGNVTAAATKTGARTTWRINYAWNSVAPVKYQV